ncbi:MAG TPA: ATP-grasp domain-containing protein [Pseudonocardiaceae bacterium]
MTETGPIEGTIVQVGFSRPMLRALARFAPDRSVLVVDEPDVYRKLRIRENLPDTPVLRELVDWDYYAEGAADRFYHRHRELDAIAVIPVVEYAVPFAARLAERYGLPGSGLGAALLLRDKHQLRGVTAAAGVANPESEPVSGPADVAAFLARVGGPVVLKPANRQASIGTRIVRDAAEVDAAWAECMVQDEGDFGPDRPMAVRMLVERFVAGPEYSVELMVHAGRAAFASVTQKFLFEGPYPVECGHLVPAGVEPALAARLVADTERVVDAVGLHTGFAHCEWIVAADGTPHLVECAGRMPGGGIPELMEAAWEYDVTVQYCRLLMGLTPDVAPSAPPRAAASWISRGTAGEVEEVSGVEEAREVPGVQVCFVAVQPGGHTRDLRNSYDRVAMVTTVADTPGEALANAQEAMDRITVKVRPTV